MQVLENGLRENRAVENDVQMNNLQMNDVQMKGTGGMTQTYQTTATRIYGAANGYEATTSMENGGVSRADGASARASRMTRDLTPQQMRAIELRRQQILLAQENRRKKEERDNARMAWERGETAPVETHPAPVKPQVDQTSVSVAAKTSGDAMFSLRKIQGEVLREIRTSDHKTLREVSQKAGVSLGYLSEVERGQKEASSELLVSITDALGVPLSQVLRMIADRVEQVEKARDVNYSLV